MELTLLNNNDTQYRKGVQKIIDKIKWHHETSKDETLVNYADLLADEELLLCSTTNDIIIGFFKANVENKNSIRVSNFASLDAWGEVLLDFLMMLKAFQDRNILIEINENNIHAQKMLFTNGFIIIDYIEYDSYSTLLFCKLIPGNKKLYKVIEKHPDGRVNVARIYNNYSSARSFAEKHVNMSIITEEYQNA